MKPFGMVFAAVAVSLTLVPLEVSAETTIKYRKSVSVEVGQSVVVHGIRGECGEKPNLSSVTFPRLETGELSLGKMGERSSNRCGGMTPAIEVIFTATKAGRERFEIEGDPISVRVKE